MPKVQRQAALLSSFSVGWCASASLDPFQNNPSDFLLLLSLPPTHTFNCWLLICCWCVLAGLIDFWNNGSRFHPCVLRLTGVSCEKRRAIMARNLICFKTSSAGLKASDMIVLVHKLTQRVLIPPA